MTVDINSTAKINLTLFREKSKFLTNKRKVDIFLERINSFM